MACVDAAPQRLRVRAEALHDASKHYGYTIEDIGDVLRTLRRGQWHKHMELGAYRGEVADVYGVDLPDDAGKVYLKFYIDQDNILHVLSFKPKSP